MHQNRTIVAYLKTEVNAGWYFLSALPAGGTAGLNEASSPRLW